MRKLIVVAALLFVPLLAGAQESDTLLTPDGTLFTVGHELASEHAEVETNSAAYLVLTTRVAGEVTREIVPASRESGVHYNAAIAFDSESGSLFLFWIHHSSMLANQLMFTSRNADGAWTEAASFGAWYDSRKNLRIAVTRKFETETGDLASGLSVHLAWWEFDSRTARFGARYAMVTIDGGRVADIQPLDLVQFLPEDRIAAEEPVDQNLLNQPMLFPSARQESVLLVYGDLESGSMQSLRIKPRAVADGRLRVPGGKREGSAKAPVMETGTSRLEGLYGGENRMAIFARGDGVVRYAILQDGAWSETHVINLDEQITPVTAVDALRRLVNEH